MHKRGEGALSLTQLLWTTRRHSDNDDQRDDSNVLCLLFRHKVFLLSLVFSSSASSSSASLDNERLHVSEDNDGFHGGTTQIYFDLIPSLTSFSLSLALSSIATLSLMKEISLASSNSLFSAIHLVAPSSSSSLPSLLLIEAPPSSSSSSLDLSLSNSSPLDCLVFDLKGRLVYDPITTALPVPSSSSFPFDGNGVLAFSRHRSQLVPLFARSRLLTPVNPPQFEGGKEKEEEDNGDDRSAASLGVYCLLNGSLLLSKYCPRTSTLETSHALLPILIEEEGSHSTTPTITSPKHLTSRVNSHLKQVIPFTTATNKTSRSKYACLHFSSVSGVKESKLSLLIFAIKPLPAPSKHEEHESLKPFSSGVKPGTVRRSSVNTPGISPAASSFLSCQLLSSLKIRDNFIFEGNCDDHLSVVSLTELKIKGGVGRNRLLLQDGHHLSFYAFFPATNSITLLLSINIDTVPTPLMPPTNPPKSSSSSSFLPPFLSLSRHKSVSSSDLVHAYLTSSQLLTFAANKTSTRVSIHPLLTSLSSPLLPQADGVLVKKNNNLIF